MTGRGKKSSKKKKFASGVSQHNLLAFGSAEGLPSDDSEDSDYQPSDGEQPSTSKRKRGKKQSSSQPAVKKSTRTEIQPKNTSTSLDWSHRIPNELLHKIFLSAVHNFSAVPFLCRISQVCRKWQAVASDASLWYSVDLSFMANSLKAKDETLNLLRGRNFLKHIQNLNFNGWHKLTSSGLEVIGSHCMELRSIDLSKCGKVTARGVSLIASYCTKLTSINLSYVQTDVTSNMSIKNLLHERGCQLEALYLAGNKSIGTPSLIAVQSCCENLKILDLSCTSITSFHVEKLQAGCPHLIELRLSQLSLLPSTVTANQMDASAGFPDLELLSLASITGGDGTDDRFLQRLLKTSSKLRQLDLRGCEKISHQAFPNLPAVSLEQLFLSRCKISWKDLFKIIKTRWRDSLKELDVSWCNNLDDVALLTLASIPYTIVTTLNLAGTGVGTVGVRSIVDSCPNLTELNLTSCRGVPRGVKQLHGAENIRKLRAQLHSAPEHVELDTL
ncbi:F-box LRR-repeat 6-like [Paramuricea clavata]|uniref:F-box LRR-repeat 6-like n=1 Tax=Paramuricea clavata TaxID=317549 RepID=A0A6S7H0B9_PARCT|nr:F-box LRR-repeat 6-like [Paramuricea clavata]